MLIPLSRCLSIATLACAAGASLLASPHSQSHRVPKEDLVALQAEGKDLQDLIGLSDIVSPIGILVANIHSFPEEWSQVARTELEFGDRLKILAVVKDSLGHRLGFQPGDVLMELNSIYVPKGKDAIEQLHERILPQIDWDEPLTAMILRDGYAQALEPTDRQGLAGAPQQ